MHILLNGNFWDQPTVGSGQYLHGLLRWLPRIAPHHRYTLLLPAPGGGPALPEGVSSLVLRTPFDGHSRNLAKLWFEQISVPQAAHLLHNTSGQRLLLHVPYFAPPARTSIVPLVTTIPDIIPIMLPEYRGGLHVRAYMRLVCRAAHRSTHSLTFSEYSRQDIVRYIGLPAQRVSAILLAADERYTLDDDQNALAAEQVAARYDLHSPFVYYVGGLDARKNVAVLVRAAALLRERGAFAATLAIAGRALGHDSRLFPDLDGLIARYGAQDYVRRIGVPHADGPLLYRACTLFAFPSTYEGFGLPPLEAMACGAPVVVSNASSLPEVVGDAALQVAPADVAGWAAALEQLLTSAELRADLRVRGLARAARFAWRRVAEETLAVYEQVMHETGG